MEIIGIVTYTDELTVGLAVESLKSQPVKFNEIVLLDNVSPMRAAFNTALDYCQESDVALLLAADAILEPRAADKILPLLKDDVFMIVGRGKDIFFGDMGMGGFFLWNMKIWQKDWRYGKGQIADIKLAEYIEQNSDYKINFTQEIISTHHPIWTPKEMWGRVRFTLPKYIGKNHWIKTYEDFFKREIKRLPQNITLQIGYDLFSLMVQNLESWVLDDKDSNFINTQFEEFAKDYKLTGKEYYAMKGWEETAEALLKSKPKIPEVTKVIHGGD